MCGREGERGKEKFWSLTPETLLSGPLFSVFQRWLVTLLRQVNVQTS